MQTILKEIKFKQAQLYGQVYATGESAYLKNVQLVLFCVICLFIERACTEFCEKKFKYLMFLYMTIILVILLVQIRIAHAAYKSDLAAAMTELDPFIANYNDCVDQIDRVTVSSKTKLEEADTFRNRSSILNLIVLFIIILPILGIATEFTSEVDLSAAFDFNNIRRNVSKNWKEWVELYQKMN